MDPLRQTPTEPADYALLSAAYAGGIAAVVLASRASSEPLRDRDVIPLGLASFALAKLLAKEKVESWVREPFLEELPDGRRRPKGRRVRYAIGELLSCTRCVGAWSSLTLVGVRALRPHEARTLTLILGASALNDFLQAGFASLCAAAGGRPAPEAGDRP